MLKKYFLTGGETSQLSKEDLSQVRDLLLNSINFADDMNLLRRRGEVLTNVYSRLEQETSLLQQLESWSGNENANARDFSLYLFQILADVHLSNDLIYQQSNNFMTIFSKSFKDSEVRVKVRALQATTAFLTSIDETDLVMKYSGLAGDLIDLLIVALQTDEDQGKQALSSLNDMANAHSEFLLPVRAKIIDVVSQIIVTKTFEDSTRNSAMELVTTLVTEVPAIFRMEQKVGEFFVALTQVLMELEDDDIEAWGSSTDEEDASGNTPSNAARDAV